MIKFIIGIVFTAAAATSSAATPCKFYDERVCAIEEQIQKVAPEVRVIFREDNKMPQGVGAQYEWALGSADVIYLGDTRSWRDNELFFVIAHEIGHSVHKHGRKYVEHFATPTDKTLPDVDLLAKYRQVAIAKKPDVSDLNYAQEFEADEFAVKVMLAVGKNPMSAMRGVLVDASGSNFHPARGERFKQAKDVIASYKPPVQN